MTSKSVRDEKQGYKYARIKMDLSIQILEGQLRPHDRFPSLNEIVHKYKVSKITARRVLHDLVIDGLVYASRGRGSFVADVARRGAVTSALARHGKRLGVVFEHGAGVFMSSIIMGIDEEAFAQKAQIHLCLSNNSYEREAENLQRLAQQGVDRILLFMVLCNDDKALNVNIPLYLRLQEQGVRLLFLNCNLPGIQIPSITWDDYDAHRQLMRYMKEQGRRRVGYVYRIDNSSTAVERLRGFKDGLLEQGLAYDSSRIVGVQFPNLDSVTSAAYERTLSFLEGKPEIDGVVCSDEMVAAGVLEALEARRARLRRFPLVGGVGSTRNLHVLRGHDYILLEEDPHLLGREAAAMILRDEFRGGGGADWGKAHRVIPVPLRVPKSLRH